MPAATSRAALSMTQDLIYCTTGGCIKNQKHVALPLTEKRLTRSVQLVDILNKIWSWAMQ